MNIKNTGDLKVKGIMFSLKKLKKIALHKGNLIFCCMDSRENYYGLGGQENNNPNFQGRHS